MPEAGKPAVFRAMTAKIRGKVQKSGGKTVSGLAAVTGYEVMFALRTGVTILLPKTPALDAAEGREAGCWLLPEHQGALCLGVANPALLLKDMNPDYLQEVADRGFVMIYETQDDEVVRCTPCRLRAAAST